MILPIGNNCHAASELKNLNYRTCSYPFDWISASCKSIRIILPMVLQMSSDELSTFLFDFFDTSKNSYDTSWDNRKIFANTMYDITFPHDDLSNLLEKYTRRFKRMKEDFFRLILLYYCMLGDGDGIQKMMSCLDYMRN